MGVAGIYDHAKTMDGPILSVASLTREPCHHMAKVHDREPVVIDLENWRAWLDGSDDLDLATPWADDGHRTGEMQAPVGQIKLSRTQRA